MTLPEVLLWQRLRGDRAGVKFRRQHPIGPCVVDFYCATRRLVVDVDGEIHSRAGRPLRDADRDRFLARNGNRILHIAASVILRDADEAAAAVALAASPLHRPADGPPPRAGEDREPS